MLDTEPGAGPRLDRGSSLLPYLELLRSEGSPARLSLNGRELPEIRDAESFRKLADLVDRIETIAAIREGLDSIGRGEGRPAGEVLDAISGRAALPGEG